MSITASCGCKVHSGEDIVPIEYEDEEIDFDEQRFVPVTIMGCYCRKCAQQGVATRASLDGFRIVEAIGQ